MARDRWRRLKGGRNCFTPFPLTFRVAEPEGLARHLRLSANGVTARGLGEESEANEAGNPVLYVVGASLGLCHDGKARFYAAGDYHYHMNAEPPEDP